MLTYLHKAFPEFTWTWILQESDKNQTITFLIMYVFKFLQKFYVYDHFAPFMSVYPRTCQVPTEARNGH